MEKARSETSALAFLDQKRKHYLLEIGAAFLREGSARVLVSVVDEDTMGRLEDAKVPSENYEKLVEWIRVREVRLTSRSTRDSSSRDPNAMVYAAEEGPSQYEIHTLEAFSACPDSGSGASQRSTSPWTSWELKTPGKEPQTHGRHDWVLQTRMKTKTLTRSEKGKGKGKA